MNDMKFAETIMQMADAIKVLMEEYNKGVNKSLNSFHLCMTDDGKLTHFISYHTISDTPYESVKVFEAERGTYRTENPLIILAAPEEKNAEN